MATAPPLCLEPDPHLTRITNNILRASAPVTPSSLKRKAVAMDLEDDEGEKARRAKIMQYMNPRINRSTVSRRVWRVLLLWSNSEVYHFSYRILEVLERSKQQKQAAAAQQPAAAPAPTAAPPPQPSSYPIAVRQTPVPPTATPVPTTVQPPATPAPSATPVIVPIRKSATPAPVVASSNPSNKPSKAAEAKKGIQSPVISTTTSAGAPTTMPAAIPPHMQHYQQTGRSTPSPPAHSSRPSTAGPPRSPMPAPVERPMSTVQVQQAQAAMAAAQLQARSQLQARVTPMPQRPSPRVPPAHLAAAQGVTAQTQQQMQPLQPHQQISPQMQPPQVVQQMQAPSISQQMQATQGSQQVQVSQQSQQPHPMQQQPQPTQQSLQPAQAVNNVQMPNQVAIAAAARRKVWLRDMCPR